MRLQPYLLPALALLAASAAADPQPPLACPALAPPAPAELLRQAAKSCDSQSLAMLYYNRAYHADLLEHYRSVMRLDSYRGQEDAKNYHAYRIFIGLSEALAQSRAASEGQTEAVAWLNSVYERAGEIAELRLKGYDNLADRMDRQVWAR